MDDRIEAAVETYDGSTATLTGELRELYGAAYAGPPYFDGPEDVADFVAEWPELVDRTGFRLVVARLATGGLAGFALGHVVEPDSGWWPANRPGGTGDAGRVPSFGIAELGVRPASRRRGVARLVHEALLAGRPEAQVVLWVRSDAPAAVAAYRSWGYRLVGDVPDRPPYQVMCLRRSAR